MAVFEESVAYFDDALLLTVPIRALMCDGKKATVCTRRRSFISSMMGEFSLLMRMATAPTYLSKAD